MAGATLLQHYSDEESIDRLVILGSVTWLEARPEDSITYFRDNAQPWENCRPYTFGGGTERFFARYWGVGPEWLYVWTPDGWLGCKACRGRRPKASTPTQRRCETQTPNGKSGCGGRGSFSVRNRSIP